jgi:hypothetical protein
MHQDLLFLFVRPKANVTRLTMLRAKGCHKAVKPVTVTSPPAKIRQQPLW